jgi:hypothetical protein
MLSERADAERTRRTGRRRCAGEGIGWAKASYWAKALCWRRHRAGEGIVLAKASWWRRRRGGEGVVLGSPVGRSRGFAATRVDSRDVSRPARNARLPTRLSALTHARALRRRPKVGQGQRQSFRASYLRICQATPGSRPVATVKVVHPDVQVLLPRSPARFFALSR